MIVFQKSKYRIILGIALLIMLCTPGTFMSTVRAEETTGTISLSYVIPDAMFRLYKIGEVDSKGDLRLAGEFANYAVDLESDSIARTLEAYVRRDRPVPIAEAQTGENKTVKFDNLDFGVYLLCGEPASVGDERYIASPALIYLPVNDNGIIVKDVSVHVKYEKETIPEKQTISVVIIWNDKGYEFSRPSKIIIQLLRDDEVFDTVELDEKNNWKHEWTDLDGEYTWTVVEKDSLEGYEVTRDKDDFTYIIINTKTDAPESKPSVSDSDPDSESKPTTGTPPDSPSDEVKLPQTGQLWWPVFTLICIGLFFLIIGMFYKRKDS